MTWTHHVRPGSNEREEGRGPQLMFAGILLLAIAAFLFIARNLHVDLSMPLAASLLFASAAAATLVAWWRGKVSPDRVNYWDVAGALVLIGICAAATIDPEQFARIAESGGTSGHQETRISTR